MFAKYVVTLLAVVAVAVNAAPVSTLILQQTSWRRVVNGCFCLWTFSSDISWLDFARKRTCRESSCTRCTGWTLCVASPYLYPDMNAKWKHYFYSFTRQRWSLVNSSHSYLSPHKYSYILFPIFRMSANSFSSIRCWHLYVGSIVHRTYRHSYEQPTYPFQSVRPLWRQALPLNNQNLSSHHLTRSIPFVQNSKFPWSSIHRHTTSTRLISWALSAIQIFHFSLLNAILTGLLTK